MGEGEEAQRSADDAQRGRILELPETAVQKEESVPTGADSIFVRLIVAMSSLQICIYRRR